jgi:hypothetical protein
MGIIEGTDQIDGLGYGKAIPVLAYYDFAVDGGAVGDIVLRSESAIPSGAVIVDTLILTDTVLTSSGSATVALKANSAADLVAATAISSSPWSAAGAVRGTLNATHAPVVTTAKRSITATVATAALTAGKFRAVVWYVTVAA